MKRAKSLLVAAICLGLLPSHVVAQSWQPSDQQKTAVVSLANAFFAAMDDQRFDDARGMMTPGMQNSIDPAHLRQAKAGQRARYGKVTQRRVASVSWYPNGSQEGTGVAAGVDFQAQTEGGGYLCGYLAIIERMPGEFEVLRHDSTAFLLKDAKTMSNAKLIELLDRPGCRVFLKQ